MPWIPVAADTKSANKQRTHQSSIAHIREVCFVGNLRLAHVVTNMPGATPNTRTNTTLFCAYDLVVTLTGSLQLEAAPLKHLPLVVCDSHANQASYAFPSPATGRWLLNQKATEASTFMAHWLLTHHRGILSTHVCHALSTSLQLSHTLL